VKKAVHSQTIFYPGAWKYSVYYYYNVVANYIIIILFKQLHIIEIRCAAVQQFEAPSSACDATIS